MEKHTRHDSSRFLADEFGLHGSAAMGYQTYKENPGAIPPEIRKNHVITLDAGNRVRTCQAPDRETIETRVHCDDSDAGCRSVMKEGLRRRKTGGLQYAQVAAKPVNSRRASRRAVTTQMSALTRREAAQEAGAPGRGVRHTGIGRGHEAPALRPVRANGECSL